MVGGFTDKDKQFHPINNDGNKVSSSQIDEGTSSTFNSVHNDPNLTNLNNFLEEQEKAHKSKSDSKEEKEIAQLEKEQEILKSLDSIVDDIHDKRISSKTGLERLMDFKEIAGSEIPGEDNKALNEIISEVKKIINAEDREQSETVKKEQDKLQDEIEGKIKFLNQRAEIIDGELNVLEKTEKEQNRLQKDIEKKISTNNSTPQVNTTVSTSTNPQSSTANPRSSNRTAKSTNSGKPVNKQTEAFLITSIQGNTKRK